MLLPTWGLPLPLHWVRFLLWALSHTHTHTPLLWVVVQSRGDGGGTSSLLLVSSSAWGVLALISHSWPLSLPLTHYAEFILIPIKGKVKRSLSLEDPALHLLLLLRSKFPAGSTSPAHRSAHSGFYPDALPWPRRPLAGGQAGQTL